MVDYHFLIVNQGLTPSGEAMMVSVPPGFVRASIIFLIGEIVGIEKESFPSNV
jgi:hypothetical protein